MSSFQQDYPWTASPLIVSAPMRLISKARLAVAVSRAGGLGFLAAGTDVSMLEKDLDEAVRILGLEISVQADSQLPIGVGFINWGADRTLSLKAIERFRPAAVWLFAPHKTTDLVEWATGIRKVSPKTKIWIQVGTVEDAIVATNTVRPDVLVVQGQDAGGHGLNRCASIISLVPEIADALAALLSSKESQLSIPRLVAAGGIADARGVAAALTLGAEGAVMGTRYLASHEAEIASGYQNAVIESVDGGTKTARSTIYDILRGTLGWPASYGARGVTNASYVDALAGMAEEENRKLYEDALSSGDAGWGPTGRLTTYAGTAVGLVRDIKGATEITQEASVDSKRLIKTLASQITSS